MKADDQRFIDNGDGTVTDKKTGLMLSKNANQIGMAVEWRKAKRFCETLKLGGYTDWGLPTRAQLRSIKDEDENSLALPKIHPFENVEDYWYWTSEPHEYTYTDAWIVCMKTQSMRTASKGFRFYVWPVRENR